MCSWWSCSGVIRRSSGSWFVCSVGMIMREMRVCGVLCGGGLVG